MSAFTPTLPFSFPHCFAPQAAATTGYEERREQLETTTPVTTGAAGATGVSAAYPEVGLEECLLGGC